MFVNSIRKRTGDLWSRSRLSGKIVLLLVPLIIFLCPTCGICALLSDKSTPTPTVIVRTEPKTMVVSEDGGATPSPTSAPAKSVLTLKPTSAPTLTLTPTSAPRSVDTPRPTATLKPTSTPTVAPSPTLVSAEGSDLDTAQVLRVIDGDTIEVSIDGKAYTVRYIGVDTPETKDPRTEVEWMGPEASAANQELVGGQVVRLEKDVSEIDRYGRLLRYVWVGDLMVNAELVRLGYAQVSTYPPDVKYEDRFLALQQEAREAERGLWAAPAETQACQYAMAYVSDVTVPDGTQFEPGEEFTKTWAIKNTGTCAWGDSFALTFVDGHQMGAPGSVPVPAVAPGEMAEVLVPMAAPVDPGQYRGTWQLCAGDQCFPSVVTVQIATKGETSGHAAPATTPGALRLGRLNYDGAVRSVESDEWMEIVNVGGSPLDIGGWRLQDDDGNVFVFPSHVMEPGASCRVYTNEYHPESCGFSFGSGKAIWGNDGDMVMLIDPSGNVVDRKCWKKGC